MIQELGSACISLTASTPIIYLSKIYRTTNKGGIMTKPKEISAATAAATLGKITSLEKKRTARANGKKGGRPVLIRHDFYGIAGEVWAAKDNEGKWWIISKNAHQYFSAYSPASFKRAGVTRYCPAAKRAAEELSREAYQKLKAFALKSLSKRGEVLEGMASCGEFVGARPVKKD